MRGRDTPARTRVEKEPPAGRIRGREEEKEKDDAEYENHREETTGGEEAPPPRGRGGK